ncbi:MAG: hypothetical protein ABEK03_07695 [Candidatus Bipolaricaulia bacterium]
MTVLAVLLVFGIPLLVVGSLLLSPLLAPLDAGEAILFSIQGILLGGAGLMITLPRYEELGRPTPYKYHPWIPLVLNGVASVGLTSMALWHAWSAGVWAIVVIDALWLTFFTVTTVGKFVVDRERAVDPRDSASSLKSHR